MSARNHIAAAIGACLALSLVYCTKARAQGMDDQALHRLAGASIAASVSGWTGSGMRGFAAGCGANVLKEALDATGMGVADVRDIRSGCAGAAVGALLGVGAHRLVIHSLRGGAVVAVRFSL